MKERDMNKYISFDYLYSKKDTFPLAYKMLFLKLLEEAPQNDDLYMQGWQDGFDAAEAAYKQ